jgi:hypothetical protein
MLFISLRSATVENVPKVLRVVEEIKRLRHKAGTYCYVVSLFSTQRFVQVWMKKGSCIST